MWSGVSSAVWPDVDSAVKPGAQILPTASGRAIGRPHGQRNWAGGGHFEALALLLPSVQRDGREPQVRQDLGHPQSHRDGIHEHQRPPGVADLRPPPAPALARDSLTPCWGSSTAQLGTQPMKLLRWGAAGSTGAVPPAAVSRTRNAVRQSSRHAGRLGTEGGLGLRSQTQSALRGETRNRALLGRMGGNGGGQRGGGGGGGGACTRM